MDLFYGQMKSRVQCTVCSKVSITFDPFNMLSLPIPQPTKDFKTIIKYYPLSLIEKPKEFVFSIGEYTTMTEIKQKIQEALGRDASTDYPFLCKIKNKNVVELLDKEKFIKSYIEKGDEICAYERITLPPNTTENFFLLEVKIAQYRRNYLLISGAQQICNSLLLIADRRWTVRQLRLQIFKTLRPLIHQRGGQTGAFKHLKTEDDDMIQVEADYAYYFEGKERL